MGITVKGLDEMLSKLNEAQTDEFCTQIVKDVSARLIDGAKKLTPKKTGFLMRGFTGGREVDGDMFMSAETVTKMGRVFKYTLINSVEYAPYVECLAFRYGQAEELPKNRSICQSELP